jgi:hypothetical protein
VLCRRAHARHAIMLTVLQLAFIVFPMTEPVNFPGFFLHIYCFGTAYCWLAPTAPSMCGAEPDAATVSAGPPSVGHGAIREGLNWSGN